MLLRRCVRACALLVALTLCAAWMPARAATAPDPVEINVILSLTGLYAFIGKGSQAGLQGVEQVVNASGGVNGRPIKFIFNDDASTPQTSVQLANGLMGKGVPLLLGPASTATCSAVAPLVKDGPILYCLSPGIHPAVGSWAYSANVSSDLTMIVGLRYLHDRGFKRIAILAATDASGQDQERGSDEALALPANHDMTVVAREHFAPGDVSVAAQVSRIKAANPQALLVLTIGTPFATALRAINDSGLDLPIFTSNGNSSYAQMKQYAAFMPKDVLFPDQPPLALDALTDKGVRDQVVLYSKTVTAMGVKPDGIPATSWDPGFLLVGALKKYGAGLTAAQLREYLSSTQGYAGVMGRYDFRAVPQRGLGEQSVIVTRWDATKDWWVPVSHPGGAPL